MHHKSLHIRGNRYHNIQLFWNNSTFNPLIEASGSNPDQSDINHLYYKISQTERKTLKSPILRFSFELDDDNLNLPTLTLSADAFFHGGRVWKTYLQYIDLLEHSVFWRVSLTSFNWPASKTLENQHWMASPVNYLRQPIYLPVCWRP